MRSHGMVKANDLTGNSEHLGGRDMSKKSWVLIIDSAIMLAAFKQNL